MWHKINLEAEFIRFEFSFPSPSLVAIPRLLHNWYILTWNDWKELLSLFYILQPAYWLESLPMVRETGVQSQVELYQRLKKWYLMSPSLTLNIIRYGSRVSEAIQGKGLHLPLHLDVVAIEKEPLGRPRVQSVDLLTTNLLQPTDW